MVIRTRTWSPSRWRPLLQSLLRPQAQVPAVQACLQVRRRSFSSRAFHGYRANQLPAAVQVQVLGRRPVLAAMQFLAQVVVALLPLPVALALAALKLRTLGGREPMLTVSVTLSPSRRPLLQPLHLCLGLQAA